MLNWEWFNDMKTTHLFLTLLLLANHKQTKWRGNPIKPGQLLTGLHQLSEKSGLSLQNIRTSLKKLESTQELTSKVTNKYRIITIINWEQYQIKDDGVTNKLTSYQQTTNKQLTTSNNGKNVKNEKKPYYGDIRLWKDGNSKWWDISEKPFKEYVGGEDKITWK